MTRRHPWLAAPALALLLLGLSACGEDSDSNEDAGNAAEGTTTTTEADDTEAYCEATLAIETVPEPDIDFESMSPEQQAEAAKTYASDTLVPLADEVVATAPAEVEEEVETLAAVVDDIATTGNFEAFEEPEVQQAEANLHAYDLNNCGWEQVDVRGIDYAYEGLPRELATGPTSFEFENASTEEEHEIGIVRFNDGVTISVEELLQLPEEESESMVTFLGATFAPPGESDYTVLDLEPGRYGVACFIPVGGEETGAPHFTEGMFAEFEVS